MACSQCGSEVEALNQFCTHCGARVAVVQSSGAAAAVQPAPEPSPTLPPVVTAVPSYERISSSKLVITAVLLLGIGGLGAYFILERPARSGPAPIINGLASTSSAIETYGLEKYPGARPVPSSGAPAETVVASFETTDNPEQVMGYYRVRFPVCEVRATDAGQALSADMNGSQVVVRADTLVHGSRVTIGFVR